MEARGVQEFNDEKVHKLLMGKLKTAGSLSDQMERLYESLRLTSDDNQQRNEVCHLVQCILRAYFPTCTVHQYGSSANGLGMRGCDLDLLVDFHEEMEHDQRLARHCFDQGSWEYDYQSDEPEFVYKPPWRPKTVYHLNGKRYHSSSLLTPAQIRDMSSMDLVKTVHLILLKCGIYFAEVIFVPSKRHPIVRFCHISTGISCDLSVRDTSVLLNTELLKLYASDKRTKILLFTVRYWAKRKQLVNTRDTTHKLSNYCLSMLVLYYLTSFSRRLLPTVAELQALAERRQKKDGVKRNLPGHLPYTTAQNKETLEESLLGFFHYYQNVTVRFEHYVLMTLSADVCERVMYQHIVPLIGYDVTADFSGKPLAVADPFLLNKNIAIGVNANTMDLFENESREAARKLSEKKWFGRGPSLVNIFSNVTPGVVNESLRHIYPESAVNSSEDDRRHHDDSVKKISSHFVMFALSCLAMSPTPKPGLDGILAYLGFCLCADYFQRKALANRALLWGFVCLLAHCFLGPLLARVAPEVVGTSYLVVCGSFFANLILGIGRGVRNLFRGA